MQCDDTGVDYELGMINGVNSVMLLLFLIGDGDSVLI